MDGDVVRMIVAAVRIERDDDVRSHLLDDSADCRLDLQHVDVGECARIVVALPLLAS